MAKVAAAPKLAVTNPIWLWLFKHGWEDPDWGRTPVGQLALATAIYEMAGVLQSAEAQKAIRTAAGRAVAEAAQQVARG